MSLVTGLRIASSASSWALAAASSADRSTPIAGWTMTLRFRANPEAMSSARVSNAQNLMVCVAAAPLAFGLVGVAGCSHGPPLLVSRFGGSVADEATGPGAESAASPSSRSVRGQVVGLPSKPADPADRCIAEPGPADQSLERDRP